MRKKIHIHNDGLLKMGTVLDSNPRGKMETSLFFDLFCKSLVFGNMRYNHPTYSNFLKLVDCSNRMRICQVCDSYFETRPHMIFFKNFSMSLPTFMITDDFYNNRKAFLPTCLMKCCKRTNSTKKIRKMSKG